MESLSARAIEEARRRIKAARKHRWAEYRQAKKTATGNPCDESVRIVGTRTIVSNDILGNRFGCYRCGGNPATQSPAEPHAASPISWSAKVSAFAGAGIDFFMVPTVTYKLLYCFFAIKHG